MKPEGTMFAKIFVWVVGSAVCLLPMRAQTSQQFRGRLESKLAAYETFSSLQWDIAKPQDIARFIKSPPPQATVHVGTLEIDNSTGLKFGAALVEIPGQPTCLFVDRHHAGTFSQSDRACFHALPADAGFAAEAHLDVPIPRGPYASFPIELRLPRSSQIDPHSGTAPTLEASNRVLVDGTVQLRARSLRVGYIYDPDTGTADPTKCLQFADLNGDHKIDPISERDTPEHGVAPVFHVGRLYLRTTGVNLATRSVTLTSVPASQYQRFDLWQGATIPDFTFKTLDGRTMKLSDVKGKAILLDFWATWCAACVADLPSKKAIYAKYHARGFEILGMDGDADADTAQKMVAKLGLPWPQAKPSGELVSQRFHVTSWPTGFLLDQHGQILDRNLEDLYGDHLAATLDRILGAK